MKSAQNQHENISKYIPHYALMVLFGIAYNRAIESFEETTDGDSLTSITVAVGVGATLLLSVPILGRSAIYKIFLSFAATGVPMIAGHLMRWRHRDELIGSVIGADYSAEQTGSGR